MPLRRDGGSVQAQEYHLGWIRLHVLLWDADAPGRPPVVLLHGLTGTAWSAWSAVARHLRQLRPDLPVFAPDLRGHGESEWPPVGYRAEDFAGDVAALLERLPDGAAAVAGHSLGAIAGLLAAIARPERVHTLVLVDPPLDTRQAPVMQQIVSAARERLLLAELPLPARLEALRRRFPGLTEQALHRLAAEYGQVAPQALRQSAQDLWGVDLDHPPVDGIWQLRPRVFMEDYLPYVRCPVLIVQADPAAQGWPSVLPPQVAARALELLPRARLVTYTGVGHLVNAQAAARLAKDIVREIENV
jgi:pimeloyl-ACP methyl ester carboxylesterase